jgi:hypothetical protein
MLTMAARSACSHHGPPTPRTQGVYRSWQQPSPRGESKQLLVLLQSSRVDDSLSSSIFHFCDGAVESERSHQGVHLCNATRTVRGVKTFGLASH